MSCVEGPEGSGAGEGGCGGGAEGTEDVGGEGEREGDLDTGEQACICVVGFFGDEPKRFVRDVAQARTQVARWRKSVGQGGASERAPRWNSS